MNRQKTGAGSFYSGVYCIATVKTKALADLNAEEIMDLEKDFFTSNRSFAFLSE